MYFRYMLTLTMTLEPHTGALPPPLCELYVILFPCTLRLHRPYKSCQMVVLIVHAGESYGVTGE